MADLGKKVLWISTRPLSQPSAQSLAQRFGDSVTGLYLGENTQCWPLPAAWRRASSAEFFDGDALRSDFLSFLDAWPNRPLADGWTFDQQFRHADGWSLWWTGPGQDRHTDKGVFLKLRALWIVARAIDAVAPDLVCLAIDDGDMIRAIDSYCAQRACALDVLEETSKPGQCRDPFSGRWRWVLSTLGWFVRFGCMVLVRALLTRWLIGRPQPDDAPADATAIVMTGACPAYLTPSTAPHCWYWQNVAAALVRLDPHVRARYLLHALEDDRHRVLAGVYFPGWRRMRGAVGVLPPPDAFACLGAFCRGAARQLAAMCRYLALERSAEFRGSFQFAGMDVSGLYVPLLRRQVARMAAWSQNVAATVCSLRAAGNVRAMLVDEEFYLTGALQIAAARQLGIPTVGVQHGTFFPMHLTYTLPPGQVTGAPVPDFFAVYGEHARQVVSGCGAYPAERVWVTGGQRFDDLIHRPADRAAARQGLQLPREQRIVLVATQLYPWFQPAVQALLAAAKDRPDVMVCIKTHPFDVPLDTYRAIARQAGAENVRFFDRDFVDLLAACDVLASGSSTTMFEAILLGRRTICINFSDEPDRYPYVADGGSLSARSPSEMAPALDRALSEVAQAGLEAERIRFLTYHAGPSAYGRGADTLAAAVIDHFAQRAAATSNTVAR